jgi:hypothetical protein
VLAGAAPATAQEPSNADSCSFGLQALAVVRATWAVVDDLHVVVDWSHEAPLPATAEIRLFDAGGGLVAAQTTVPVAGQNTTTVFPGVLAGVFTTGFQYRIVVFDPLGNAMSPSHYFRVFLDCSPGTCVYRTVDGLKAGSIAIDKELMLFLDGLEEAGSTDVLGDALALRPWLRGEILTLAEQLSDLDREHGFRGCVCFWAPGFAMTPAAVTYLDPVTPTMPPPYPDFETGGVNGPGAKLAAGIQIVRGPARQLALGGISELIMHLRCWNFGEWRTETVEIDAAGKGETQVRLPVVEPCEQKCPSEIRSQTDLEGKLEVEAYGTLVDGAESNADSEVSHYLVDRTFTYPLFTAYSVARAEALGRGASSDLVCTHKSADQTRESSRVSSVLKTSSLMEVSASTEAYSLAVANVGYWMESTGEAVCAVEPTSSISLSTAIDNGKDDGLEIELWGHPR